MNITEQQKELLDQIKDARQNIRTDSYDMSIGELINLYNDDEIKLDPAFQRLFRWDDMQKTKLVESILIGIPIPEIFVAQKNDGTWHVVDGVQRLSTIFQLVGKLNTKNSDKSFTLTNCKFLSALEGLSWNNLPLSIQREFKKSRLRINIMLTQNSDQAQYELFQRLNTGGTSLEPQEVRNCLILMLSIHFYDVLNELKAYPNFVNCLTLKDHQFDKEYHMELILRMYIGYEDLVDYTSYGSLNKILLDDFIDKETVNLIEKGNIDKFAVIFRKTFDKIYNSLGKKAFIKYYDNKKDFSGQFNVSVFEMITSGVSKNIDTIVNIGDDELKTKIIALYSEAEVQESLKHGIRAINRFKSLTVLSKRYFS